ncbi:ribonuclease R family protein [Blattabacterium cuenoti]|uniref:ribonuclease R family protein n=1 Tax=Blattabacterium cuenoti TaxID=1653831 RepID=UPI00163CE31F|nr:VacB/RNase II family 3'-5' exoribonuclease [Blattabacterium cuenoti]
MKNGKKKEKKYFFTTGTINITNYGYAFVHVEGIQKDIFIPKDKINRSLEGDLVKIKFKKNKVKPKGEVLKIIKRNKKKFIGILKINPQHYYNNSTLDISNKMQIICICNNVSILIPKNKSKKYKHDDKVLVEITRWPKKNKNPIGRIIKVFGKIGIYKTEIHSLLEEYEISNKFSHKIKDEAKKIFSKGFINFKEKQNRKDMRSINTFTIDPIDAKDFDDAISIRKIEKKIWEIGIHISDVTHYLKENSIIDKEAYIRTSSIYLMGKVIPMLPNILSDELCSLQPEIDKLSFSLILNINERGNILKSWIGKTIIRSNKKFTYNEVQKIIDKKKGKFYKEINILYYLSRKLIKKRLKNGSLYLDRIETKFQLNEKNDPISIDLEKNKSAHSLIEEFMLLTNQKISEFISKKSNNNNKYNQPPSIYRIHDKPDHEKILYLKQIIKPLGYSLDLKNIKSSINHLLLQIKGKPEQHMIENFVLRSMSKAKYSTKNIGHYGLSFIHYTHFTSPIRRYSDIITHRLLQNYLMNNKKKIKSIDFYEKKLQHCSNQERIILDIEREFFKYMQIKFAKIFLQEKEFDGVITGFNEWSIYIDLIPYHIEGMIKLRNIKEDCYTFNSNGFNIIGKDYKNIYFVGDKIKVKIIDVDLEKKYVILDWINK